MFTAETSPFGGVLGGGGLFGIGFALGVLDGLKQHGIDLRDSPILGTSAGSWVAAATVLGVTFEELTDMPVPSFPNPKSGLLAAVAREIFHDARSPQIRVMACKLPRLERTVLDGGEFPLADLIAASSSVPGLLAPHTVGDARYVDGGVRSGTSVDLGPTARRLIVVAPLAGAMWGPFARFVDRNMYKEIEKWTQRTGGQHTLFTPSETAANIARNPKHLFDKARAIEAYHRGFEQGSHADALAQ